MRYSKFTSRLTGSKAFLALVLSFIAILCYLYGSNLIIGRSIDYKWRDMLFSIRGTEPPDENIVICALDEDSFEVLEEELPFSPKTFIKFFNNLKKLNVSVVGLDFILYEFYKSEPDTIDIELKSSLKSLKSLVFASKIENYFKKQRIGTNEIDIISSKHKTSNRFFAETGTSGLINSSINFDGIKRASQLVITNSGAKYDSFILKLYESFIKTLPAEMAVRYRSTTEIAFSNNDFIINYAGGPKHFAEVPFYSIIEMPDSSIPLLRKKYENKIFIVGPTFYESHDFFMVPFSNTRYVKGFQSMAGVEVIASALNTLLKNNFIHEIKSDNYALIFLAFSLAGIFSFVFIRSILASGILATIYSFGAMWISCDMFLKKLIFMDIFGIVFMVWAVFFGAQIFKIFIVEGEKRHIKSTLSRYMSASVVDKVLSEGENINLSGTSQNVAVMFADIRNFTTLSEKLSAEQTVRVLNVFFKNMVDIIFKNEGTLDKYIGDCIMVVFGAPKEIGSPVKAAINCAIEMQKSAAKSNAMEEFGELSFNFGIGIGINYGKCVVGNIGSEKRMEYTAIGDVVNTASRIQAIAAEHEIILTLKTIEALKESDGDFYETIKGGFVNMGEVSLKGKENKVEVYKLTVS